MIFILSGAGLSAESGIKTFRDHDGLWENYDVMEVCSAEGWQADPQKVTQFYNARRADLSSKEPNAAHYALADLQNRYGDRIFHATQNVDDLLERAGAKSTVHLHGTLTDLRCESCGEVFGIGYRAQDSSDRCPACDSTNLRHNVVMFGEAAPNYRFIGPALQNCDLFVAIGTSGQVLNIASFAQNAAASLYLNPKRESYVTGFGDHGKMIDEYFTHRVLKTATEGMDEVIAVIERYLKASGE
jgi:NAD-dependent deacetylase